MCGVVGTQKSTHVFTRPYITITYYRYSKKHPICWDVACFTGNMGTQKDTRMGSTFPLKFAIPQMHRYSKMYPHPRA